MVTMQIILEASCLEKTRVQKLICQLNPRASFKAMHLKATTTGSGGRDWMAFLVPQLGF